MHRLIALSLCVLTAHAADPLTDLVNERVVTSRPDHPKAQTYEHGAVMIGDLFKCRQYVAITVATKGEQVTGVACHVHSKGDWREILRADLGSADKPWTFAGEWPFTLADLDGDMAPELLISQKGPANDRIVGVWRFDREQQLLIQVGNGLRSPAWHDGHVIGRWKTGATSGDIGCEEHVWVDGRLVRQWLVEQRYPLNEYLIGSGEPAVRVNQTIFSSDQPVTATAVGNVAHYRAKLPAGERSRPMRASVKTAQGQQLISITPQSDAVTAAGVDTQWDALISAALFDKPGAFSAEQTITVAGKSVPLKTLASINVSQTSRVPTYQYYSMDNKERASIQEPPDLPAQAVLPQGTTVWTDIRSAVAGWGSAFKATSQAVSGEDALLYIRLPNFTGYELIQIETGVLITDVQVKDNTITVTVECTLEEKPNFAPKDLPRPLLLVNLGRLAAGDYTLTTNFTGLPNPPTKITTSFTCK